jgi:hypothetical protein
VTREAVAQAVDAGRRLSDGRLARASVLFPDTWARILPLDLETLPSGDDAVHAMVQWKLKKLLPGVTSELRLVYREMAGAGEQTRLLVAAAPADTLASIEDAFGSLGVRVGALAPFSLALFEGLAPMLSARTPGDYALVHRSGDAFVFLVAQGERPLFFRQRPAEEPDADHDQELRLSLTYYAEKLKGSGLGAVYVHDARGTAPDASSFPAPVHSLNGGLFGADATFDERVSARPELLPAFAAVYGRP